MKSLIFADIHIHPHKKQVERLQDCLETLEWIFKNAVERNVQNVICVGDLFVDRQKIDILTYQRTFEIFQKYSRSPFEVYLLVGNHDMWYSDNWDITSLKPLSAIENVHVIEKPCTLPLGVRDVRGGQCVLPRVLVSFLPYTDNPLDVLAQLDNNEDFKLLFAHLAVNGAVLNTRAKTRSEEMVEHDGEMVKINCDVFQNWNQVFLGHYHAAQQITPRIEYVGSPLQLSYGEAFDEKHIIVYDHLSHEKEYIINDFSPKHFIHTISEAQDIATLMETSEISKEPRGGFFKILTESLTNPENVDLQKKLLPYYKEVKVEPFKKRKTEEELEVVEIARSILNDEEKMAEKYIDHKGTNGLDKAILLKVFNEIRKRTSNV